MAGKPSLLFHSFSGNSTECQKSLTGVDGGFNGYTFGTGFYSNSNGAIKIPVTAKGFTNYFRHLDYTFVKEGALEFWVKFDGWSLTNTASSDAIDHRIFWREDAEIPLVTMYVQNGAGLRVFFQDDVSGNRVLDMSTLSLSASTWYHMAVAWSDANDLVNVYIDNVLKGQLSGGPGVQINGTSTLRTYWGQRPIDTGNLGLNGWFDGVIGHSEFKTDYSERFNKRRYMFDQIT